MQRIRRWLTVWIIPLVLIAVSVVPLVYYGNRYPDPLAVHWGISGEPNGTLPLWLYAGGLIGGMLLVWYGLITGTRRGPNAPLTSVVYFILGLLAAINAQVLFFNLDAAGWDEARNLSSATFVGLLLVALVLGWIGWMLAGGRGAVPEDVPMEEVATTATTWSGRASNLWIAVLAAFPMGLVFVLDPIWALLMVVLAILLVIFAFVRVEVREAGVRISLGPLGFPRRRLSIDKITGAGAVVVHPLAYGGWGWRMRSGRRAYIIRGGPAIRIERANRVATIVTVDDAQTGSAVIDTLARERRYT